MPYIHSIKNQYLGNAVKTIGIYALTNFFVKGTSFLLLPLFTDPRYLTPADNGLLSLFAQSIIFLIPFISLGVLQSASVDYFKLDKKQFRDFCTTGITMSAGVTLVFVVLFWLFSELLYEYFKFPLSFFWIIPLVTFSTFCFELLMLIVRNRGNAFHYMRISLSKMLLDLMPAVVLIVAFAFAWKGRVTSILISSTCIALYALWYLRKNNFLFGKIRMGIIKSELKYSVPIIAMQFSIFCLFSSDSFLLAGISHNNSEVGIYGMACLFSSIIFTLCTAVLQFMVPKINEILSKPVVDFAAIRKHLISYTLYMSVGFLFLVSIIPVAYRYFIDPAYYPGLQYYIYLCAGYFLWSFNYFLYIFLLYYKEKRKLLFLSTLSIIISLSSNYIFIKNMGTLGAAISVFCSYLLIFLVTIIFTKSHWKPLLTNITR